MIQLPTWEQLPTLELYLDQVLLYVNQEVEPFQQQDKPLTAAMINNYVKHGYLSKPNKKKYGRKQVARLIVLACCKAVFPISEIAQLIELHYQQGDSAQLYDTFVHCLAGQEAENTPELIQKACQTILAYQETMTIIQTMKGNQDEHES